MSKEFGRLVASLRKELRDEQDLPWTQRLLAEKTGVSPTIIRNIEAGHRVILERETLVGLAQALQLTHLERREFFHATTNVTYADIAHPTSNPATILALVIEQARLLRTPTFIADAYGNILAFNQLFVDFWETPLGWLNRATESHTPPTLHLLEYALTPASNYAKMLGEQWHTSILRLFLLFRIMSFRYRHTSYFNDLFKRLHKSPGFKKYWYLSKYDDGESCFTNSWCYEHLHPRHGYIRYLSSFFTTITSMGDLHLHVYLPMDASTADHFITLVRQGEQRVHIVSHWPSAALLE